MRVPFDRDLKGSLLAVLFLSGLLLAAGMQNRYDSTANYLGSRGTFVSMPPGKTLKVLSFGYHNLAADMLFIWSIQFYSTYYLTNRFDYLERIYDAITDITPEYKEPYIVGAMIMVYEARDIPMALRLLDKGSQRNPRTWIFDQEAGYYCYRYLKDYARAERYYNSAAAKPDAPAILRRMNAHMVYLHDDPRRAYQMWLDIYRNSRSTLERNSAFNHLYQIKAETDLALLRREIAAFRQRSGRWPAALAELAGGSTKDFAGNGYIYDALKGTVTAARVFRWKRR